jgi:branched-chain amino acid transport system permease protein
MNPESFMDHARALEEMDYRDRAADFDTPTRVLWGARDPIVSREQAASTADALGAELEVVEHVGHALSIEDPELFKREVARFDAET